MTTIKVELHDQYNTKLTNIHDDIHCCKKALLKKGLFNIKYEGGILPDLFETN